MSLDDVIRKSDQIFVATCEAKNSAWRDGNVITAYKIRPSDFWKGAAPTEKDGTLTIEQIGGSVGVGPLKLGQHFTASVTMIPGEEVLLFTKTHQTDPALKSIGQKDVFTEGQLQVVGLYQGRYSILTDPKSGMKHALPVGMEAYGVVASDASVKKLISLKSAQLNAAREKVEAKHAGNSATPGLKLDEVLAMLQKELTPAERDMLARVGQSIKEPKPAPAGAAGQSTDASSEPAAAPKASPVRSFEPLDSLKQRVMDRVEAIKKEKREAAKP